MGRMGIGRKNFSASSADYKLLEEVGYGASATVYRAIYLPSNEVVAVKCLDLDRCNSNLDDIRKEAQTMSLIDHPNVIRACCSFVVERSLWVVMPFMAEGSCLHLMKIAYPEGFEESVIGSILKETLKALEYLHRHGHIHRDVKAGNILLDSNGVVKLGDFGVSACMFDKGDRQRSRNTFVGTPCWMAPEVLQPGCGYDFKADIWSLGITALELAHGHAPFSKYPPMKVLLMTIQNAPPGLDYDRDKRFSKSFKEMVAMCLVKDPTKRPTAEKLLKHSFFKHAKPPEVSVKSILADLPPLWDRVKALQLKDAAQLALKKMPSAEQEALSQSEYKRGVSAWNFDVEDLKAQASLVQDDDDMKDEDENLRQLVDDKEPVVSKHNLGKCTNDFNCRGSISSAAWLEDKALASTGEISVIDLAHSSNQEKCDRNEKGAASYESVLLSKKDFSLDQGKTQLGKNRQIHSGPLVPSTVLNRYSPEIDRTSERFDGDNPSAPEKYKREVRKAPSFSGPLNLPNRASANSFSAPIRCSGGFRDSLDEKSKANVVQIRGRFSITSETVDLVKDVPLCSVSRKSTQGSPLRKSASVGDWLVDSRQLPPAQSPKEAVSMPIPASVLMPHLQNLFQQTAVQQDLITNLLNSLQQTETVDALQTGKLSPQSQNIDSDLVVKSVLSSKQNPVASLKKPPVQSKHYMFYDFSMNEYTKIESASSERERLLLVKISELQARMSSLTDELTAAKLKQIQLNQQLNAAYSTEDDGSIKGEKDP